MEDKQVLIGKILKLMSKYEISIEELAEVKAKNEDRV